jgi:hypothetical protein
LLTCSPITLIADSGSSGKYATIDLPVINSQTTTTPITIKLPNGHHVTSTHESKLNLPMLLPAARHVHIVPGLHNCSLLSIGQLCDSAGYEVLFINRYMSVLSDGQCILQDNRSAATRLWHVTTTNVNLPLPAPPHYAATAIGSPPASALVSFAHADLFSPALLTLEQALLNGYLVNFPVLTLATLRKHPPHSVAIIKGHLDQTRQNLWSTFIFVQPFHNRFLSPWRL